MRTVIGITGGIGCGKSTAAALFAERGFLRLDSDQVVRDEVLTEPEVCAIVSERFGREVVGPDGALVRSAIAKVVFSNPAELAWLEEVVHPRLYAICQQRLTAQPAARWVVEVPLLFEKGLENWFDFTVCLATSSTHQLARLAERGLPQALAVQRISKQLPLALKIERADFVLSNDGTPEFLREQVARLIARLDARG